MKGKLKELREGRHLTQAGLGSEVGASQQNISKYEQDICSMPIDMLIRMAKFYTVTTDYILGISEVKRNYESQVKIDKNVDECYDLVEMYQRLGQRDREIVAVMLEQMSKTNNDAS